MNQTEYGLIEKPYVTVIVPVYNEESCVKDCIVSLLEQDFRPLEILAVDDGSIDNSVKICEQLEISVLRQDHKGPGAARNLGARNAKGNILVLVDADMTFASDYIERLIEPIVTGQTIATCHWNERVANWDNPWARCQTWFISLPDKKRHSLVVPEYERVYRAVRKDFFLDTGGFSEDEGRADDSSIARRTRVLSKIVSDAICYHRNFETPRETFVNAIWHGRNMVAKNHTFLRSILVLLIYKNPILKILKGLRLALIKKEIRMIPYSIIYTLGFVIGTLRAIFSGYYLK